MDHRGDRCHAKNSSLFIEPGGTYRLTPFYDILSAYPLLGGKGSNVRSLKLAMSLKATKGKKYQRDKIYARHFIETAQSVGFPVDTMNQILDDFVEQLPIAIDVVSRKLPQGFPEHISSVVLNESMKRIRRLSLGR
ncbi:HipA domain-containing protein [Photobacterium sp. ZSDE20]|uniref:HipA domain-containing protein n=1 Tax=Photobacterium pectinilyticum TaxID=2906793 RepID=A0ABT1N848_9GAMM|nr:HipA domain-containing protein [Photobacterium sp. ZSDE20]MCQ1060722.1 HipA domain-containing protein [Photobacterium sp. ZSDE20]MDD1828351.1 HipA domain-containing protein [Photobacterium sp. ZSDE20]